MSILGNDLKSAAVAYGALGLRVIPLEGKRPRIRWRKESATDRAVIERWWDEWPDANIGLVVDDLVLDIDAPGATHAHDGLAAFEALTAEHGALPQTWSATTGGGGRHVWLNLPEGLSVGNSSGKLPPGIDVRSGGRGFVVAPPSIHPDTGEPPPPRSSAPRPTVRRRWTGSARRCPPPPAAAGTRP